LTTSRTAKLRGIGSEGHEVPLTTGTETKPSNSGGAEIPNTARRKLIMCSRYDPLWTIADVSKFLGVPIQTIYDWRTRGYGPPGIRIGRYIRFKESDVFAWLDKQTSAA
jgi:predicted DNA-binding transcriptional regulator AlpA